MKEVKFEEVTAEVIDDELAVMRQTFDAMPAPLNELARSLFNAVSIAQANAERDQIADEQLANISQAEAKNFAQGINRDLKAVSESRKALKNAYTKPISNLEARLKTVLQPIEELQDRYKARQEEAELEERNAKMAELREFYEGIAPFLALPLEGQTQALVPFERIAEGKKWGNRTMNVKKCEEELEQAVEAIAGNQKTLEGMELAFRNEAMNEFWRTLSLEAAINRDRELADIEQRRRALESAQEWHAAEARAEMDAQGVTAEEAAAGYAEKPAPAVHDWQMTFKATDIQKQQLIQFAKQLGIKGKVRCIDE